MTYIGSPDDPPIALGLRLLHSTLQSLEWGRWPQETCFACGSTRTSGHAWECPVARALFPDSLADALMGAVWDAQFMVAAQRRHLVLPMEELSEGAQDLAGVIARVQALLPKG